MSEHTRAQRKRNSSKVNLTISIIFHTLIFSAVAYWAAHEGLLGSRIKELTVTMAPKEKKPEPPKAKAPEPKVLAAKPVETPRAAAPPPAPVAVAPPPSAAAAAPAVAPAAVVLPDMIFDGGKAVETVSDPNAVYKNVIEQALHSRWNRPDDVDDHAYVAELALNINPEGKVSGYQWNKRSGDSRWDKSIEAAVASTKDIGQAPPKGFPTSIIVRFDVETFGADEVASR